MKRAQLSILSIVCAAALTACGDTGGTSPVTADSPLDAADVAPLLWRAPATPGTVRDAVLAWNGTIDAFFQAPIYGQQSPPADARSYALANVAIHDAVTTNTVHPTPRMTPRSLVRLSFVLIPAKNRADANRTTPRT